ncbi:putative 60S ribosomal protein L28e [Elsinoe australis]|uniref:Putative 60S ribosomal protein L28e n=1 Tax=Elsinoe australis TaxID=40998 RepID=A0A4U7AZ95_9PEZI|nr:putative 60S ribosomal protein L28e [Elsinoe australis]
MATQYDNISPALVWECTRHNNSFLVKRKQAGGVSFSRDPLNLLNKHSNKYAGYSNAKAIGINAGPNNKVEVTTKTPSKANKPASSLHKQSFSGGKSARNISRSVVSTTAKKGYRSDLRAEAVARVGAIKKSQRPVRERQVKTRTGRKGKGKAVEA